MRGSARPLRARVKSPQTMVAGARDDARPVHAHLDAGAGGHAAEAVPLPNVVAVAPRRRCVRPFVAPPEDPPTARVPHCGDCRSAPAYAARPTLKTALPTPDREAPSGAPRAFTPPPERRGCSGRHAPLPGGSAAARRWWSLTRCRLRPPDRAPSPRDFVPPPAKSRDGSAANLPAAPEAAAGRASAKPGLEKVPRGFVPPAEPPARPAAAPDRCGTALRGHRRERARRGDAGDRRPESGEDHGCAGAAGSRPAGFSAGPEVRKEGEHGGNGIALLNVPGWW